MVHLRLPGLSWIPLTGVAAQLLIRPGVDASGIAASAAVQEEYLSEDSFPGLVVLEPLKLEGGAWALRTYYGGQLPSAAPDRSLVLDLLGTAAWISIEKATDAIGTSLGFAPLEPLQTPWAVFDAQGGRLQDLEALKAAPVAFFLEVGVWMWPAVRIGFEQQLRDVGGGTALLRTLSLRPKVFEVREFLSREETEEVMRLGKKQGLHASQGKMQSRDLEAGTQHTKFRTSKQAWLGNSLSPLIAKLDLRISDLTRVPASHNEPVQLLRYGEGQYYHGHMDWTELELYDNQRDVWISSHFGHQGRLATVFWYLNDVEEGGETFFPKHGQPICEPALRGGKRTRHCTGAFDPDMKSCDGGLKVPPRKGSVILWYNFHPSGRGDRNSLHAGCPVGTNLTKWSANKWVTIKPLDSRAQWIEGHPALKRHGWVEGTAEVDPNACQMVFFNEAGVQVDVMWQSDQGELRKLEPLLVDGRSSLKSFRGHQFLLRSASSGRDSNVVACTPPRSTFTLSKDFRLKVAEARTEL